MKRIVVVLVGASVLFGAFAACTRERPPPRVCETPPPQKKKEEVRIGTCPIEWGHDTGTDAFGGESGGDTRSDG